MGQIFYTASEQSVLNGSWKMGRNQSGLVRGTCNTQYIDFTLNSADLHPPKQLWDVLDKHSDP